MSDPERIWLQSYEDTTAVGEDRLWCEDKVWPANDEDHEPTEYIRADLYASLRREVEEARADKARLDFLDECNARLNTHHGTTYGWEMVMNYNVNRLMTGHLAVDLNDAKAHGFKSCRGAIDDEMKRIEAARAARQNQGGEK